MLRFQVTPAGAYCKRLPFEQMRIDAVYDFIQYDAGLSIAGDGALFFEETVAIVEFYWFLWRWLQSFERGLAREFAYATVEHTEPILTFSPQGPGFWRVDSIWRKQAAGLLVSGADLRDAVRDCIAQIRALFGDGGGDAVDSVGKAVYEIT